VSFIFTLSQGRVATWSPKDVGAILSQREGKHEKVVVYANKSLMATQKKFHPMEGECYALI
jgi:hypothetical protein